MPDPFEIFKQNAESNRKRILKNKKNGDVLKTRSSSSPLSDKTNTYRNRLTHTHKEDSSKLKRTQSHDKVSKPINAPKASISQLSRVFLQSRQAEQRSDPTPDAANNSINQLSKLMRVTSKPNTGNYVGVNSRFRSILTEFKKIDLERTSVGDNLNLDSLYVLATFVNWFKNNKFDYILFDKNNELTKKYYSQLQRQMDTKDLGARNMITTLPKQPHNNDMLLTLTSNKYLRPEFRSSKLLPTHLIQQVNRVGRFLYSAKVISLNSLKSQVCLLMATDIRFELIPNTLLVLDNTNSCYQKINEEFLKIYLHWHVYSNKPIDVNFFKQ